MTFKRRTGPTFIVCVTLTVLAACLGPGQDVNSIESGISVHLAEVHLEERLAATTRSARQMQSASPALTAPGGYNQSDIEHHDIVDSHSHLLSIYRAYLVLDELELVPCTHLAQLPYRLFESMVSTAAAHAGHGSEPVGGRGLDKSNVIDIVTRDLYLLPLGDRAVAPGSYCGLRVSLARANAQSYGKPPSVAASNDDPTTTPEVPELAGKFFALRADYCVTGDGKGGCLQRNKVDVDDDSDLVLPSAQVINFSSPLVVTDAHRSAYIAVGIAYGEWVQDIDVMLLISSVEERQKLVNNIAKSIHVYSKGLGALPVNVAGR